MNLHEFISIAIDYLQAHKDGIIAIMTGGVGLSAVLEAFLGRLDAKGRSLTKKASYTLLVFVSAAASFSTYWISSVNPSVAITFPWLTVIAGAAHRYFISGKYEKYVLPVLQKLSKQPSPALPPPPPVVADPNPDSPTLV